MKKLLFFVLLVFSLSAQAVTVKAVPWFNTQGTSVYQTGSNVTFFNNPEASCRHYFDRVYSSQGTFVSSFIQGVSSVSPGSCFVRFTTNSSNTLTTQSVAIFVAYQCPAGFTKDASGNIPISEQTCSSSSCPAGMTANQAGQCVDNCAQYKDQIVNFQVRGSPNLPDNGVSVCMDNSCESIVTNSEGACLGTSNVQCYGNALGKYSGKACTQSSVGIGAFTNPSNQNPAPTNSPEADCIKQGKTFGTVNGQVVCVSQGTPGAPTVKTTGTTTTNTSTTDTQGNTKNSGSSQTETVSQDGQIVKTEKKTTNSDGTITTETKEQPIDKFCEQNPNSKLCKLDSENKFSGTCAASFTCEGDAIQCAIALKQHQAYCEAIQDDPVRDQFINEVAENAGKGLSDWIPQSVINIPTDLTGQKLLSSACIPDMTFPLAGQSFNLPLSKLCPALEFCGTIVKLFSYLFSAIIIFGRRGA